MPIYAKLTMARVPLGKYVPSLGPDSILLAIGSIGWLNYLMLSFLEGNFY